MTPSSFRCLLFVSLAAFPGNSSAEKLGLDASLVWGFAFAGTPETQRAQVLGIEAQAPVALSKGFSLSPLLGAEALFVSAGKKSLSTNQFRDYSIYGLGPGFDFAYTVRHDIVLSLLHVSIGVLRSRVEVSEQSHTSFAHYELANLGGFQNSARMGALWQFAEGQGLGLFVGRKSLSLDQSQVEGSYSHEDTSSGKMQLAGGTPEEPRLSPHYRTDLWTLSGSLRFDF